MREPLNIIHNAPVFDSAMENKYGRAYLQSLYDRCVNLAYSQADLFGYRLDPLTLSPILDLDGDLIMRDEDPKPFTLKTSREISREKYALADELETVLGMKDRVIA